MKRKEWSFLYNPFEVATNGSYRAMKKIGAYTLAALKAYQPGGQPPSFSKMLAITSSNIFNEMAQMLQPLADDYNTKYNSWVGQRSGQKSTTSRLANSLALLSSEKIRKWDIAIQAVYDLGSESYMNLLPNRRKPFQKGSQDDIISAVGALSERANKDDGIPTTLKQEISDFFTQLDNNLDINKEGKSTTKGASNDLENARLAYCEGLYEVLGTLMVYFKNNPVQVGIFFDQETIRTHEQTKFHRKLKPLETVMVMEHKLAIEDQIKITNSGGAAIQFYLVSKEDEAPGTLSVTIPAHTEDVFAAAEFGDITKSKMMAKNTNPEVEGVFTLVLV